MSTPILNMLEHEEEYISLRPTAVPLNTLSARSPLEVGVCEQKQ